MTPLFALAAKIRCDADDDGMQTEQELVKRHESQYCIIGNRGNKDIARSYARYPKVGISKIGKPFSLIYSISWIEEEKNIARSYARYPRVDISKIGKPRTLVRRVGRSRKKNVVQECHAEMLGLYCKAHGGKPIGSDFRCSFE
jgi:hypothetical protein